MYGERLRAARAARGVGQLTMALALKISQAEVSRVENGLRAPWGSSRSVTLAKLLGHTAEEWTRWAADGRSLISFVLGPAGAGEWGRPVLTLLWSRYRDFTPEDWERIRKAIEGDTF
jgi:transcriptional regulator with XRE-family HTH domain